jgi:methylmalonyl-CoA/ethylmalonyl-CoA epimerase
MKIHHIGYAVKDIDKAINEFRELGYCLKGNIIKDEKRNVLIQFMENNGYKVEFISPYILENKSPVDQILKKNGGAIPYHLCYVVEDISIKIKKLQSKGYILIEEENEAKAIDYRKVAFLYNRNIGVIELVEKE